MSLFRENCHVHNVCFIDRDVQKRFVHSKYSVDAIRAHRMTSSGRSECIECRSVLYGAFPIKLLPHLLQSRDPYR